MTSTDHLASVGNHVTADVFSDGCAVEMKIWPARNRLRMSPSETRSLAHRLLEAADAAEQPSPLLV